MNDISSNIIKFNFIVKLLCPLLVLDKHKYRWIQTLLTQKEKSLENRNVKQEKVCLKLEN